MGLFAMICGYMHAVFAKFSVPVSSVLQILEAEMDVVYEHLKANEVKPSHSERYVFHAMANSGVARGNNFWGTTFPLMNEKLLAAGGK